MQSLEIDRVVSALQKARRVLFVTGAGLSADSGLPTYRGVGGLYDEQGTEDGVAIEEALSGSMFAREPELTWKYIIQIAMACRGAQANAGHHAIAAIQRWCEQQGKQAWVLTQNIDGLHRQAGSEKLIEMHGYVYDLSCTHCDYQQHCEDLSVLPKLPRCPQCQSVVRPDVVLFEEMLPSKALALYEHACVSLDLVFVIGTSALFPYISAPVIQTQMSGGLCVELNLQDTAISQYCEIRVRESAAQCLTVISEALCRE